MAQKKPSNPRIWGVIIIVFGLIFAGVGGSLTYVAYDFSKRGIATSGIVTAVTVSSPSSSDSGPTFKPTLRYIDQNGKTQSGQTFLSSSGYNYAIGTKLPILYDPMVPSSLRMDSWFALWGFGLIFLVIGLLIMAGGAALWHYGPRLSRRPTALSAASKPDYSYSSQDGSIRPPTLRRK